MPGVRIRLLGGFEVEIGGRAVVVPGRKAQALVARLAHPAGREVPRASLAALLWPDRGEEQARGSLRQALSAIRRALGDGVLRAGPDAIALEPGAVEVDVAHLAGRGERLDAFRPFLAGFPPVAEPFDDWVHAERAALSAAALEGFRARLEAAAAAGEAEAGLVLAERALAVDPAFEPAYRARMRLLAGRGDRAAALREYERCREALARALGVEPSAETEALRRALAAAPTAAAPRGPAGPPTLAVLPFEILSEERDHALFARGLAEDIQVELSRFRSLRVVAHQAAARAEGRPPDEAGRLLGVDYLLLATVRGGGGRLRVSARLVEAATGRQVWADRLDGDLAEVLGVQDRITRAVVSALALRIDGDALARAHRTPPEALDAYALWLEGMDLLRRGTRASDLEARRCFERALEIDPTFARAHTGLSLSYFNDWSCTAWERWDEDEAAAFRHAREATRLDDQDHVTHCILGRILLYRREFGPAEAHLRRALALNANDADVLAHLSLGFGFLGDAALGLELGEAACRLNPNHPDFYGACLAVSHLVARAPRAALALLERAPDAYVDTRAFMAATCAHLGETERARDHARRFLARYRTGIDPGGDEAAAVRWLALVNPFRREEDRDWLARGLASAGLAASGGAPEAPLTKAASAPAR